MGQSDPRCGGIRVMASYAPDHVTDQAYPNVLATGEHTDPRVMGACSGPPAAPSQHRRYRHSVYTNMDADMVARPVDGLRRSPCPTGSR